MVVFPIDIMSFRDYTRIQERKMLEKLTPIKVEGIKVGLA